MNDGPQRLRIAAHNPLAETAYMRFEDVPNPGRKTRRITVFNKSGGYPLGYIHWHGAWRQYVFEPEAATIFNVECLASLADRVGYLNTMHRAGRDEHA